MRPTSMLAEFRSDAKVKEVDSSVPMGSKQRQRQIMGWRSQEEINPRGDSSNKPRQDNEG